MKGHIGHCTLQPEQLYPLTRDFAVRFSRLSLISCSIYLHRILQLCRRNIVAS